MQRRADDAREEALRLATADERHHTETIQALDLQRQAIETLIDGQRIRNAALTILIARTAPAEP